MENMKESVEIEFVEFEKNLMASALNERALSNSNVAYVYYNCGIVFDEILGKDGQNNMIVIGCTCTSQGKDLDKLHEEAKDRYALSRMSKEVK